MHQVDVFTIFRFPVHEHDIATGALGNGEQQFLQEKTCISQHFLISVMQILSPWLISHADVDGAGQRLGKTYIQLALARRYE